MSLLLTESFASLQPEPTSSGTEQPAPSGAPQGPGPGGCAQGSPLVLMAVMFGVFYFLLIRPQQKRQREQDDLLKALRRGDKVRTSSGIRGEIADLTDTEVSLIIAEKVKINVLRSHIASREGRPTEGKAEESKS